MAGFQRDEFALGRGEHTRNTGPVLAFALAVIALAICQYRYGIFDQGQYLVQVIGLQAPEALGPDPYLDAFGSLRSVFWVAVASVTTEATRPALCLALALAITAVNAWLLLGIGRTVLPRQPLLVAAAPALLFVVPKEQNWFGLVSMGDIELTATLAVMPLAFGSLLCWMRGRLAWSLALAAAAVPLQGQTAAYLLTAWWVATAWTYRRHARAWAILGAVGGLGLVALLVERAAIAVPDDSLARLETIGRSLYPELIDPLTGPLRAWCGVIVLLALGACTRLPGAGSRAGSAPPGERRLVIWAVASLAFPIVGLLLLAADLKEPLLWRLMVGRSLMLPQIAALVLFATWCARLMQAGGGRGLAAAAAFAFTAVWPVGALAQPVLAVAFALILVFMVHAQRRAPSVPAAGRAGAGLVATALALAALAGHRFVDRPYALLAPGDDSRWVDAQRWARANTPPATVFITPPYLSGWRVQSHRPTVGEVKDGGLLFYAGQPALAWVDRVAQLGAADSLFWLETPGLASPTDAPAPLAEAQHAYRDALSWRLETIRREQGAQYVVTETAWDVDVGERVWANEAFVIRRLRDSYVVARGGGMEPALP
jgi:hypothetical protein